MRSRTVNPVILAASLAAVAIGPSGCGGAQKTTATATADSLLAGTVRDAAGNPVAGAKLANPSGSVSSTSNAAGQYTLGVTAAALGNDALAVTAANYASTSRVVPAGTRTQDFVLRAFDTVKAITVPTGSAAAVTASAARGDGTVTLTIPADSLVTAAGTPATGAAEVRLTYWHPINDMHTAPASLVANFIGDGNGPYRLSMQSLGMVDVQVVQGDAQLQVAPGANLGLDHALPDVFRQAMAQKPNDLGGPYLFYYDPNISMWSLDGNVSYNAATGTLMGQLPHMTAWNYDNFEGWSPPSYCTTSDLVAGSGGCGKPQNSVNGGCLAGRALLASGSPAANTTVRLWLFDSEHVNAVDLQTDSSGNYCTVIGTRLCVPGANNTTPCTYTSNDVYYLVSDTDSPDHSSMANPIPAGCGTSGGSYNTISYVSQCGLFIDPQTGVYNPPGRSVSPLAQASISVGTTCGGGGCGHIPDVTLSGTGNKTVGTGTLTTKCAATLNLGVACTTSTAAC